MICCVDFYVVVMGLYSGHYVVALCFCEFMVRFGCDFRGLEGS